VGKNKLAKWAEMATFSNVIEPPAGELPHKDHPLKGKWQQEVFRNSNPVIMELGCGKGEYTVGLASSFPQNNYIGVDIKGARMWRGAKTANEKKLPNVIFLRTRIEFIRYYFEEDEIDEIWLTFPDPHPGKRNSNKRLTCPWFLNTYSNFVKDKGIIHLKTDNTELFDYTKRLVEMNRLPVNYTSYDLHADKPDDEILSIKTHYENLFLEEGLKIKYLSFRLLKKTIIKDIEKDGQYQNQSSEPI
jgi:tRNA (guanine-N7-)-methyltransferase